MKSLNKKSATKYNLQDDHFRWLADNSTDIIHVLDEEGSIRYINPAITRILGYTQEEMIGQNAFDFVYPDDQERITQAFIQALATVDQTKILEMRIRHKNGHWITFEVASKPVVTKSGEINLVINSRDITQRKQMEKFKDEFLALVAHELKTPLTTIKLIVNRISYKCQQYGVASDILKKINYVDMEINRLTGLINEILDISRLESGTIQLNIKKFNLIDLIQETISQLKPLASQKINLAKQPTILIDADRDRVKQVLINLISNSIKYSKPDGKIHVKLKNSKNFIVVAIKDEGAGISKEKLPYLFDRFFQVENSAKLGSGLGLYITKEIVNKHGGKVWVESKEGKGSIFYFSLPLSKA